VKNDRPLSSFLKDLEAVHCTGADVVHSYAPLPPSSPLIVIGSDEQRETDVN